MRRHVTILWVRDRRGYRAMLDRGPITPTLTRTETPSCARPSGSSAPSQNNTCATNQRASSRRPDRGRRYTGPRAPSRPRRVFTDARSDWLFDHGNSGPEAAPGRLLGRARQGASRLTPTQRLHGMTACDATSHLTAAELRFARLWAFSGAPVLVGYEASIVTLLARTDLPMYEQLTSADLDDPAAVLTALDAINAWRLEMAAGTRSIAFGPRVGEPVPS